MTPNLIYRILITIPLFIFCGYLAFYDTPELDGVKNSWLYRLSFFLMLMNGGNIIFYDVFNLFPLE